MANRKWGKAEVKTTRTRAQRAHALEAYATAKRRVKISIKADKRNYVETLAT
jgi:hypothetical protein